MKATLISNEGTPIVFQFAPKKQAASVAENSQRTAVPAHLAPHVFQPGVSGNPGGRPKNSMKDYIARKLAAMTDEEKEEWIKQHKIPGDLQWKMAEGNPAQGVDVKGEITNLNAEITDEQLDRLVRQRAEELNSN